MIKVLTALAAMLAGGVAMAQTAAAPAGGCQYQGATLPAGAGGQQYLSTRLTVPRNGRCSHAVSGDAGQVQIVTPPRNGRAEASAGGVTYAPNPGFTGTDEYVFSGRSTSGRVQVTVSVRVE